MDRRSLRFHIESKMCSSIFRSAIASWKARISSGAEHKKGARYPAAKARSGEKF
jgi:hypothetical protein